MLLWLRPGNHLAKIRGRGWKLLARCRIDRQPPAQPWLWRPGYYPLQFDDFALQDRNVLAQLARKAWRRSGDRNRSCTLASSSRCGGYVPWTDLGLVVNQLEIQ